MALKEIDLAEIALNPFDKIGKEWMLVTAGTPGDCNTMTASWGGLGVLWGKPTATAFIRPQRRTKEFVDREGLFTLSFFGDGQRSALKLLGTVSGHDDPGKIAKAGLTEVAVGGSTAFAEAQLVLVCRTIYSDFMPPENFVAKENDAKWYPDHDYHTMYIAEVEQALVQE